MSLSIDVHKNPEESVKELMQERLDHCRKALQKRSHPHNAIHDARKDFKKIRAICRLVRKEIGKEAYRTANFFFRDTARKLSDARDASAMLETLYTLEQTLTDKQQQFLLKNIKNHLGAHKAAITRTRINKQQLLKEVLEDLKVAEQYFSDWSFQHYDFRAFHPNLQKVYKRCRKGLKSAYQEGTPEAFHEWRKRVKYLRYQIKMLTPIWPRPMAVWEEELHQLTDDLGADHDLTVLFAHTESKNIASDSNMKMFIEQIATIKHTYQKRAKPLGYKLFFLKPSRFSGLIVSWWSSQSEYPSATKEKLALA